MFLTIDGLASLLIRVAVIGLAVEAIVAAYRDTDIPTVARFRAYVQDKYEEAKTAGRSYVDQFVFGVFSCTMCLRYHVCAVAVFGNYCGYSLLLFLALLIAVTVLGEIACWPYWFLGEDDTTVFTSWRWYYFASYVVWWAAVLVSSFVRDHQDSLVSNVFVWLAAVTAARLSYSIYARTDQS